MKLTLSKTKLQKPFFSIFSNTISKNIVTKSIFTRNITALNNLNLNKSDNFYNKNLTKKNYHPTREVMKKFSPKYFSDPNVVGEELIRIICLHDKVTDPSKVTMSSTFEEIGLDSLDFVEVILETENYLNYDFGAADWEQFITIDDMAQFLAQDYFAQKH